MCGRRLPRIDIEQAARPGPLNINTFMHGGPRMIEPPSAPESTALPSDGAFVPGRAAARRVDEVEHTAIDLPLLGTVRLPRPEHLAYYGAVGVLAALEVIEWPVAVLIATGHALAHRQHNRTIHELGEALEEA
jgi:hypothetical protein